MTFDLNKSIQILERTPGVLKSMLGGLDNDWVFNNEGPDTFSPYDVVGHLVHGERSDWIPRIKAITEGWNEGKFKPFDRFAHYEESKGKTLDGLLNEFAELRTATLSELSMFTVSEAELQKTGVHPALGTVTLAQLLSTWTVHDLAHLGQITRVMAKQYRSEVGPWKEFFRILQ